MGEVRYDLIVNDFVERYMKNKNAALLWATTHINKELFPAIKPLIREELKKRGVRFKEEQ